MDTNYWNPLVHIVIWASILSWFVVPPFLSNFLPLYIVGQSLYYGVSNEVLASSHFWFYFIITAILGVSPVAALRVLQVQIKPTLLDDVRLLESTHSQKELKEKFLRKFSFSIESKAEESTQDRKPLTKQQSLRSSYAFAHEKGFAELIVSGRYIGANEIEVAEERVRRYTLKRSGRPSPAPDIPPIKEVEEPIETSAQVEQTET